MATFNGTAGDDTANAALGQLSGFTGGTLAQLQDLTGDLIFGFDGDDFIFAGNGNDQIEGWEGRDIINGGAGNDTIWAMQVSNVEGSLIGDVITGNDGDDDLFGSAGGDSLDGSAGTDDLFGGGGDDLLQGGTGRDDLFGGAGGDTLYATDLAATAETAGLTNSLNGEAGNDAIIGADTKDFITGGAGADAISGGGGDDETYFYDGDIVAGENIDGGSGRDTLLLSAFAPIHDFRPASISGIEGLLIGLNANPGDTVLGIFLAAQINAMPADLALISGTMFTSTLRIEMAGETSLDMTGANLFSNWGPDDLIEVFGDADGETMLGANQVDHLSGNGGNDRLDGGLGDDRLEGGGGADVYVVDTLADAVIEAAVAGTDTVETTLATYSLHGIANVERLTFTGAGDFIGRGNGLDNRLIGGLADDRFVTDQGGADRYFGDMGIDAMDFRPSAVGAIVNLTTGSHSGAAAGDFFSSLEAFYGSDTAGDTLTGAQFNDRLDGYGGSDTLVGLGGNDTIMGGVGDDEIAGGALLDFLYGNAGADDFNYAALSDSSPAAGSRDRIYDFQAGSDDIDVSAIDAKAGTSGNNAFDQFIGAAAFTVEGQARWSQSGLNTVIEFNTAGTSGAEMQIQLQNFTAATLTVGDFIA